MKQESEPQKNDKKKVKLKMLDCEVNLEGNDSFLYTDALNLLSVLIQNRLQYEETLSNMGIDEEEYKMPEKNKKLQFDVMFL